MNPAIRSKRKLVLGSTVLALLAMAGIFVWAPPWEAPSVQPISGDRASSEAEALGSASDATEMQADDSSPTNPARQPVTVAHEAGSTSLLVRFLDRATGAPVAKLIWAASSSSAPTLSLARSTATSSIISRNVITRAVRI